MLANLELENSDTGEITSVPDYPGIARLYAEAVASGRLPTNRLMVAATQRYLDMLEMAEQPGNDFYYEPKFVVDYCLFGERLQHFESGNWEINQVDAEGNVDPHIILEPFEIWIESAIHGFRRRLNGTRLVETALELIPRKNAKSLRAARAALFDLCCSGGLAPEIPIAAASAKQADDTLFGDILKMVNNDDELRAQFGLKVTKEEISRGDGRIFKLTSLGEKQDGLNPSLALFEEGHAGAASVYKVVDSAFGARPNALRRMITTAGYRAEGPAHELLVQATMILEGKAEDFTFFAAIYTLDREDYTNPETNAIDWDKLLTDETLIAKANPMYRVSLDPIKIKAAVLQAHRLRPDLRGEIARTRFNIWTGAGMTLIEPSSWAACQRKKLDLSDFLGWKCWIGVDLAQVLDMCAISLLFEMPTGELVVFSQFYLPEESPTAQNPDLVDHLALWEEQGYLILTPGPLADHDRVRADVEVFCDMFQVQVIACDPAQAHNTVKHLWDGNKPVMVYPNSAKTMTPPVDDILGRIAVQTIWHDGNPVLAWNAQNVHGDRRGNGLIIPRKDKENSPRKIDGFVALCFANGCRLQPGEAKPAGEVIGASSDPYLTRGIIGFDQMVVGGDV
ncbi:terminase large subunit [Mesorhizobium sp. M0189]|uniref:terminase TerL endonuclease subunit n=1 Tax=Mesorhizobium sp. M0189 TaxID=2956909 RepID=UPI003339049D